MTWFNPPTTKVKQRAYVLALARAIEKDAPHLTLHIAALRWLEGYMYNRVPPVRGRSCSVPMTPAVKAAIRHWHALDPLMAQHAISTRVGVNQGRVNNTIRGVRK